MDEFNKEPDNNKGNNKIKNPIINKVSRRTKSIVDKDGFYVILFICICIVTTTAVWVSKTNFDKANNLQDMDYLKFAEGYYDDIEDLEEDESKDVTLIEIDGETEKETTKDTEDKGAVTPEEQKTKVTSTSGNSIKEEPTSTVMAQPTLGNLLRDYADSTLVYSKTLEQWTTHNGIDIKATEGTVVKAVLDGTVKEIEKDTELGIVVTLDHGNGLETKYGCLSTDEMVKVGQKLKKGDAISGIGKGVGIELSDGPHLHFEVLKDGKNVNPKNYLPKIK
ncbi:M23 family metallopeptidase [Proteiniborus sp. MB09-C3]|uniref:M23 family metallopeptidase n=1 Tax=Proteiniborus sp. MB09-C3 TaxID=3050072 RepID=UPI002555E9C6|nr:M23 family metallopeptidase [Proteiniborus sp. MB09-C3]WIV12162.1 M23 family metallopeptidase [Proteiniborus sp. MB09-C3]